MKSDYSFFPKYFNSRMKVIYNNVNLLFVNYGKPILKFRVFDFNKENVQIHV